jgi:hypothetical protein
VRRNLCFLQTVFGATATACVLAFRRQAWPSTNTFLYSMQDSLSHYLLLAVVGASLLSAFIAGAALSSLITASQVKKNSYAGWSLIELTQSALLIICSFPGLLSNNLAKPNPLFYAVPFLFLLGMQNATIKTLLTLEGIGISGGILVALAVEIGEVASDTKTTSVDNSGIDSSKKLALLASLVASFSGGILLGLFGFHHFGFHFFLFLAATLAILSAVTFVKAFL